MLDRRGPRREAVVFGGMGFRDVRRRIAVHRLLYVAAALVGAALVLEAVALGLDDWATRLRRNKDLVKTWLLATHACALPAIILSGFVAGLLVRTVQHPAYGKATRKTVSVLAVASSSSSFAALLYACPSAWFMAEIFNPQKQQLGASLVLQLLSSALLLVSLIPTMIAAGKCSRTQDPEEAYAGILANKGGGLALPAKDPGVISPGQRSPDIPALVYGVDRSRSDVVLQMSELHGAKVLQSSKPDISKIFTSADLSWTRQRRGSDNGSTASSDMLEEVASRACAESPEVNADIPGVKGGPKTNPDECESNGSGKSAEPPTTPPKQAKQPSGVVRSNSDVYGMQTALNDVTAPSSDDTFWNDEPGDNPATSPAGPDIPTASKLSLPQMPKGVPGLKYLRKKMKRDKELSLRKKDMLDTTTSESSTPHRSQVRDSASNASSPSLYSAASCPGLTSKPGPSARFKASLERFANLIEQQGPEASVPRFDRRILMETSSSGCKVTCKRRSEDGQGVLF